MAAGHFSLALQLMINNSMSGAPSQVKNRRNISRFVRGIMLLDIWQRSAEV